MIFSTIQATCSEYPEVLKEKLKEHAPEYLYAWGDTSILDNSFLGLICSIQCPGNAIIKTLDAAQMLRDARVPVIGGFHSPMEKECLEILLRGKQPVVLCPARGIRNLRIGEAARLAVKEGRLLVLSLFPEKIRRTTSEQAVKRNNLVASLAKALWVPHAAPGGKIWLTIRSALDNGQQVFSFDVADNKELFDSGATPFAELDIPSFLGTSNTLGCSNCKW